MDLSKLTLIISMVLLYNIQPIVTQTCEDNFSEACIKFVTGHHYLCYDHLIREVSMDYRHTNLN